MVDESLGNPNQKHFVIRYIVPVTFGGVTVRVHREVARIMLAFLRAVSDTYQDVPDTALGWVAMGDEDQRAGLRLSLPAVDLRPLGDVAARLGLTVLDGAVRFEGTAYEAELITRRLVQDQTTAEDSIDVGFVDRFRPGTRPLEVGDSGPDVAFLQDFLQHDQHDGVFDEGLADRLRGFQRVRFLPETGRADQATWLAMFPERPRPVDPGDGGMWVLMVQSLLAALDYSPDVPTAVYGTRTVRSVRELQRLHGLRVTGTIRGAEWGVLTHRPVDGFPLADPGTPEPPAAPPAETTPPAEQTAARPSRRRAVSA